MDVFGGNSRNVRDRIARVLPQWPPDVPGQSILLGMHAFGLEECGDYARAEDLARQAVERQPLDCWAHHCLAHVMEMQGRTADGIDWLVANESHWAGDDNFLAVYNWWHLALFHLELGRIDEALVLYDEPIRGARSTVAADLIDASVLLWRLYLAGADVGERWRELSEAWDVHADGRLFPFNDWHAVMAHLSAGRAGEVERIVSVIRSNPDDAEVVIWARETGLPLIEGFAAFWHGDYRCAAERLYTARYIANRFGGSHAQRDIIDRTLTEAALRGGLVDLGEALAHERLALKPHSPANRAFLSRARAARTPNGLAA